ncbi:HEAT repeat domain-containing protein [uncultured Thiothrix sp.]|uniref:HEAT repeat domain-containing protein n=1 Tax=uncultured Thiothrix sp. TaxID=223185 RepID=UPI00262EDAC9|nr:HEAT repeat domain-containing protein [uncultured Thiothrix sp.]HMT91709.1 HEAT repeat domain-containing protein [Thiolinea sp.]
MIHLLHTYRGQIQGLVSYGSQSVFVTQHPENQATELYRLNTSTEYTNLQREALPCSATALIGNAEQIWLAGTDGRLYSSALKEGKVKALGNLDFSQTAVLALALLAQNRLAVLQAKQVHIIDLKTNSIAQSLEQIDVATTLASSPDGLWFVIGFRQGKVAVYHAETLTSEFVLSSEGAVHQGQVTALLFAPNELQFYSAGADKKLFLTHARGSLQPLDKGKSSNHELPISALLLGKERLFTGAHDKSVKVWAYSGGQPTTLKQGLPNIAYLSLIHYLDKPALLVAGIDASLTIVGLTEEEKFGEIKVTINDGYAWAKEFASRTDPLEREKALGLLAEYDDKRAFDLLDNQLKTEQDRSLREQMIKLVAKAKHPRALSLLEAATKDTRHDTVRLQAFKAWEGKVAADDLRPYEVALATNQLDIGKEALKVLASLAHEQPRAEQMLVQALSHKQGILRLTALSLLETVYGNSPKASLQALSIPQPDLQRAALIRLYQRNLLQEMEVQRALLLAQPANDANLRHTAFLVAILSQANLTQALKALEPDLARQLQELEDFELLSDGTAKPAEAIKVSSKDTAKLIKALAFADYNVLLQGMSNRHADISFLAAFALAVLQDQRAFGILLVLSQESNAAIRAGVGRAFAWLNQADSIPSLEILLNDQAPEVRDAAFNALQKLQANPLLTAERGFASQHQDIHARSLKSLLDVLAEPEADEKPKKSLLGSLKSALLGSKNTEPVVHNHDAERALHLLQLALNDPFEPIRQETLKTCLNRQLGGSELDTLRLLLTSRYENLHREVLLEVLAKARVLPPLAWVEPLLFELFHNRFASVRLQALQFALTEKKRIDTQTALAAAINSPFADVQGEALVYIQKNPSKANQTHLPALLTDEHDSLRNLAIKLLVDAGQPSALLQALTSPYADVQVTAANALVKWGNPEAFKTLENLLARPEPSIKAEQEQWLRISSQALACLASTAQVQAFPTIHAYLQSKYTTLVEVAAKALPYVVSTEQLPILLDLQADERPVVRVNAGFALALLGEPQAKVVLAEKKLVEQHLSVQQRLAAQLALEPSTPLNLQSFLQSEASFIPSVLALVSHEFLLHGDEPELSTWALSLNQPALQQFCADLLVRYSDEDARWAYVERWLQQQQGLDGKDQDKCWNLSSASLQQIAAILVYGSGHLKAYLLDILVRLTGMTGKEWQLHFEAFSKRFDKEVKAAETKVVKPALAKPEQAAWNQRAFGAYLGLVRQDNLQAARLKALRSLQDLAQRDQTLHASVVSSFLTLLNHEQVEIRLFAFDTLQTMGVDLALLGNTATTSPRSDIARKGLELLIKHYPIKQSHQLLQTLIASNHEVLAPEAWKLYSSDLGLVKVAPFALESNYPALRLQVVNELAAHYTDAGVHTLLVEASNNSTLAVAMKAAETLAQYKHPQAFNALVGLFKRSSDAQKRTVLNALRLLPSAEPAQWLVHYLNTEFLSADLLNQAYEVMASQRPVEVFKPLLQRLEQQPKEAKAIIKTLVTLTGFDQPIADYKGESADKRWLDLQFPRHEALLIQLFNSLIRLNYLDEAVRLAYPLGWVQSQDADNALADTLPILDTTQLRPVLQAMSHRALKREGRVTGLLTMLTHKDLDLQFLAAEGLANSGHQQGFSILLAAMDYQKNDEFRQRAVLALGQSGDERALDKLLKLAEDQEHFLHEAAIEAIGHLGQGEQGERIFKQIKSRLWNAEYFSDLAKHALNGLRWLNTQAAWTLVQDYAADGTRYSDYRVHAVSLLQYRDTAATRNFLLKLLREEPADNGVIEAAFNTARLLWKAEPNTATEVDYALLQSHCPQTDPKLLERLVKTAPTAILLDLIAKDYVPDDPAYAQHIISALGQGLLDRSDYQVDELQDLLTAQKPEVVELVARLIGRMNKVTKTLATSLEHALESHFRRWQTASQHAEQKLDDYKRQMTAHALGKTLNQLLWTLVQQNLQPTLLLELLTTEQKSERGFQVQILTALLAVDKLSVKALLEVLSGLKTSPVLQVRSLTNQLLAMHQPKAQVDWQQLLAQPETLMQDTFANTLSAAAASSAHQAQVLPILIAKHEVKTLVQIANDSQQQEILRLGAIEGLARIITPEAASALQMLKDTTKDADIGRAAYRALRRWQRSQAKASTGVVA